MLSGRRLDLLDPSPLDVEIEDIAVGLARVARWNGQTSGDWAYSVAQHCLLVDTLLTRFQKDIPQNWHLLALLHDAPEYVIGDLITPFKNALSGQYREIEQRLMGAVKLRFSLTRLPKAADILIKRADRAAAYIEAVKIAGFPIDEARSVFDPSGKLAAFELDEIDLVLKATQGSRAPLSRAVQFSAGKQRAQALEHFLDKPNHSKSANTIGWLGGRVGWCCVNLTRKNSRLRKPDRWPSIEPGLRLLKLGSKRHQRLVGRRTCRQNGGRSVSHRHSRTAAPTSQAGRSH